MIQLMDCTEQARRRTVCLTAGDDITFIGWHRPDLDAQHQNWHYYQTTDGKIIHFRKEHIVAVVEDFNV